MSNSQMHIRSCTAGAGMHLTIWQASTGSLGAQLTDATNWDNQHDKMSALSDDSYSAIHERALQRRGTWTVRGCAGQARGCLHCRSTSPACPAWSVLHAAWPPGDSACALPCAPAADGNIQISTLVLCNVRCASRLHLQSLRCRLHAVYSAGMQTSQELQALT